MGMTQSVEWLRDYVEVYQESNQIDQENRRKILRHSISGECFELVTIPITSQEQKQTLANQIKTRGDKRSSALVTLVRAVLQKEDYLCGNGERYEILFQETAPNMLQELHLRRNAQKTFSDDEILLTIKRVAAGLKECKQMGEDHGSVSLQNISIRQNLYLRDPLTIRKDDQTGISDPSLFPCPLRLRASYDCIDYKQLPSDLFSLGMIALQMSYPQMDIQKLYIRPQRLYFNVKFDWQQMNSLLNLIKGEKLQEAICILLEQNPQKRLQIYSFMQDIVISKDLHLLQATYCKRKKEDQLIQSIKTYTSSVVEQQITSHRQGVETRFGEKPSTYAFQVNRNSDERNLPLKSLPTFGKLNQ